MPRESQISNYDALDKLLKTKEITPTDYDAGVCLANLRTNGLRDGGEDWDEFEACRRFMGRKGSRIWKLVSNVCLYGRYPRFMNTERNRPASAWKADELDRS